VLITGHSLGGSLAILCGMDVKQNGIVKVAPELHTFAGPRTGDPGFAANFNAAIPICNRVVNFMDAVPQVPLPPLYKHAGVEILVHGGFRPLDIAYAHHLTTYLAGLYKLPDAPAAAFA
jgi:triacylglycerol lipase